jgi:hypothetical protein
VEDRGVQRDVEIRGGHRDLGDLRLAGRTQVLPS